MHARTLRAVALTVSTFLATIPSQLLITRHTVAALYPTTELYRSAISHGEPDNSSRWEYSRNNLTINHNITQLPVLPQTWPNGSTLRFNTGPRYENSTLLRFLFPNTTIFSNLLTARVVLQSDLTAAYLRIFSYGAFKLEQVKDGFLLAFPNSTITDINAVFVPHNHEPSRTYTLTFRFYERAIQVLVNTICILDQDATASSSYATIGDDVQDSDHGGTLILSHVEFTAGSIRAGSRRTCAI